MNDQICPRCKTTKYRNPSLKLMVNVCGHTLCDNCVELLFIKGSGSCPDCNVPLRRNNFRVQLFEDPMIEKEVDIRKRILRDYNKKEEDFATLLEYNNYLEEIEMLIYNLSNNLDIINTNKRIEQYKKENRDNIVRNKSKLGREEYELEMEIEREKMLEEQRKKDLQQTELDAKKKKIREKEELIDKLIESRGDAKSIVEDYTQNMEKAKEQAKLPPKPTGEFSTGVKFGNQMFLPVPKTEEGPLYAYVVPSVLYEGPPPPSPWEIESKGYIKHIRTETAPERAGGYKCVLACQRALQEALQGLFHGC